LSTAMEWGELGSVDWFKYEAGLLLFSNAVSLNCEGEP